MLGLRKKKRFIKLVFFLEMFPLIFGMKTAFSFGLELLWKKQI